MLFYLAETLPTFAQDVKELPREVSKNYEQVIDQSISDEFNASKLDKKKWARRNTGGAYVEDYFRDKSLVTFESEREGATSTKYISMKGIASDGKIRTAGIVSTASGFYGFYVTRFRFRGLSTENVAKHKTIWHPSVWGGMLDNADGVVKRTNKSKYWLELDMMEWDPAKNGWGSHTNARFLDSNGKSRIVNVRNEEKAKMVDDIQYPKEEWITLGLEYTPEELVAWQWKDNKWVKINDREVKFVDIDKSNPEASYTIDKIGKESRQPIFWMLGNVVSRYLYKRIENKTVTHSMDDMSVDFDYFRYYPHVSTTGGHWSWRNNQE